MPGGDEVDLGIEGFGAAIEIGRGGYAVVFRAREEALNRQVAVKVLSAVGGSARLEREGWAMGTLSGHPNIVTVIAAGVTAEGRPYIVMPYLAQGSLADRVDREGPLPWTEVVRIGIRLAGALEAAHAAGTLHRDVKPANVLLSDYGEPQLSDFGIARVEGRTGTVSGRIAATVAYAAPEVLEGRSASVASDVYSLAATVFALVAGRPPFPRSEEELTVAQFVRIAQDPVPDLRSRGVPDAVCRTLETAMEKDPGRRQQSAAALGQQLQEAQRRAGLPVTEMALVLPDAAPRSEAEPVHSARSDAPSEAATEDEGDGTRPPAARSRRRGASVAVAIAAVALVGGVVLALTRTSERDAPAPSTLSTVPTDGCLSTFFTGIPDDRVAAVEVGARGVTLIGANQPKDQPAGLGLAEGGRFLGALRYRFSPASDLFVIESVVDGACRDVQDFANASNPRADKHALKNFEHVRVQWGGQAYDIQFAGTATIRVNVIRVV